MFEEELSLKVGRYLRPPREWNTVPNCESLQKVAFDVELSLDFLMSQESAIGVMADVMNEGYRGDGKELEDHQLDNSLCKVFHPKKEIILPG